MFHSLCALSIFPAFFLMKKIGKGSLTGFVAIFLLVFSSPYIRMMTDFVKNAVGICFLLAFLYYLHDLASSGLKRKTLTLASIFLILTGLTHILDFGVALLLLGLYTILMAVLKVDKASFLKGASVMAMVTCIFIFIAFTFFNFFFTDFNKVISFLQDLASLHNEVLPQPSYEPPQLFPSIAFFFSTTLGSWIAVFFVLFSGVALSFYVWKEGDRSSFLLLTAVTIMGFVICFPLIPRKWLWRFSLMIVIPTLVNVSYGLSKVNRLDKSLKPYTSLVSMFILALFIMQGINMALRVHPSISYAGYMDLIEIRNVVPPDSVIVAPGGIGYWVQYVDEVDVGKFSPDLWRSYSHVLGLFSKGAVPPIPSRVLFIGRVFMLVEFQPPRKLG